MASERYASAVMRRSMARALQYHGFENAEAWAVDLLGEAVALHIERIGTLARHQAEHAGRSSVTLADMREAILRARRNVGLEDVMTELELEDATEQIVGETDIPHFPIPPIPKVSPKELAGVRPERRPSVPSFLPPFPMSYSEPVDSSGFGPELANQKEFAKSALLQLAYPAVDVSISSSGAQAADVGWSTQPRSASPPTARSLAVAPFEIKPTSATNDSAASGSACAVVAKPQQPVIAVAALQANWEDHAAPAPAPASAPPPLVGASDSMEASAVTQHSIAVEASRSNRVGHGPSAAITIAAVASTHAPPLPVGGHVQFASPLMAAASAQVPPHLVGGSGRGESMSTPRPPVSAGLASDVTSKRRRLNLGSSTASTISAPTPTLAAQVLPSVAKSTPFTVEALQGRWIHSDASVGTFTIRGPCAEQDAGRGSLGQILAHPDGSLEFVHAKGRWQMAVEKSNLNFIVWAKQGIEVKWTRTKLVSR